MRFRSLPLGLILFFCWVLISSATDSAIQVRAELDRAEVSPGDTVTLSLSVEGPDGATIDFPKIPDELGGLKVLDSTVPTSHHENGVGISKLQIHFKANREGSFIIPPLEINYHDSKTLTGSAKTERLFLEVKSGSGSGPLPSEKNDIRDIKGLIAIFTFAPLFWVGLGILLTVLGYFGYRFWKNRKTKLAKKQESPPKSPEQIALESLAALARRSLPDAAAVKRFHFEVSEVVRAFLEGRFGIPATDRTTEELESLLEGFPSLSGSDRAIVIRILKETDVVKFTDYNPGETVSHAIAETAETLVKHSIAAAPSASGTGRETGGLPLPEPRL